MKQKKTLQKSFLNRMVLIVFLIILISGLVQMYFITQQVKNEVGNQASMISTGIKEGIIETELASKNIEDQIGQKLSVHAELIASLIEEEGLSVSNESLEKTARELDLAGITLFSQKGDDIVGIKSSSPEEIGFSFKQYGYLSAGEALMRGEAPDVPGASFTEENMLVLPIAQAGSQKDPQFFKFAYYHPPGKNYIISVFLSANEVYEFTSQVGPEHIIDRMIKDQPFVKNIAVLDPGVFKNPELEEQIYPPRKKVVYGSFDNTTEKDEKILKGTWEVGGEPKRTTESIDGEKIIKIYVPIMKDLVIYIALDYGKMIGPIYRHSIILLATGFVSLIFLFYFSARFFNQVYIKINKIKEQLSAMRNKNFTTKSSINDETELGILSESANEMTEALNLVLRSARNQANHTKKLSLLLEADISKSVEELYEISVDTTTRSREQLEAFRDLIESLKGLVPNQPKELDELWEIVQDKTAATTDMTITLSDIIQSLQKQSSELSEISNELHSKLATFKL